ncbi:alanine--tRNA ligase [Chlamydiales bacterium]|nr:alanine--tRNA ligase [Chlamydiales bacterium]
MQSQTIRRAFLKYFKEKGHAIIPSSPVLPHEDPTLLFTNAGMNQFKDVFLGKEVRDFKRATTAQKCVRVGGKHNDLDNVGHTKRHLTLFEMLGNFSFGDYFKKEAIHFAWEVSTQIFGFEPDKLYPTVYLDDDEAFELWSEIVPAERISRMRKEDNYWMMGDVGPCGPCSELYYDRGPSYGSYLNPAQNPDGERFCEFWNLVFMQYNQEIDGSATPLPNPSIDTGAGLERILMLQLGVDTLFETDILRELIAQTEEVSGIRYDMAHEHLAPAFRVIADHLRLLSFAIADGAQPGNIDRGYVLRKVLRRAVRYGKNLGFNKPFLGRILPRLIDMMGNDFPELKKREHVIEEVLHVEEESFFRTLKRGGNLLKDVMQRSSNTKIISGDDAFKLKDTYGFPIEEVLLLAKDGDLSVDINRYDVLEKEAKERSRQKQKVTHQLADEGLYQKFVEEHGTSKFLGYDETKTDGEIIGIIQDGVFVQELQKGEEGDLILQKTPFYAEMGGQVGDQGVIKNESALFTVTDTQSPFSGLIVHQGKLSQGSLKVGQKITAEIDSKKRQKIANNHTATHLLHFALQQVLGDHIKQAGSVVDPKRLRFDFSHHKALTPEEVIQIETLVNEKIRENTPVKKYELTYDEASKSSDIKQFFGEKYGKVVRVIDIDYSKELCGGTHTSNVGTIALFKIDKESSIAAGVRRIEAMTGVEALEMFRKPEELLETLSTLLKTKKELLSEKVTQMVQENKQLKNELIKYKEQGLSKLAKELVKEGKKAGSFVFIGKKLDLDVPNLRNLAQLLFNLEKNLILILCNKEGNLIIRLSLDAVKSGMKAGDFLKLIGAKGGGKPDLAQGVISNPENMDRAFKEILGKIDAPV